MHSVGDLLDAILREHSLGNLGVTLGDPVYVVTEVERKVGQIQRVLGPKYVIRIVTPVVALQDATYEVGAENVPGVEKSLLSSKNATDNIHRELVVPRRDRRMGREDALLLHRFNVGGVDRFPALVPRVFIQQLECQQARVPLVHVKALDFLVAQGPQHLHPANSKNDLLAEAVM